MLNPFASSAAWGNTLVTLTNLEQILDRSPLTVPPDTLVRDAIAQMIQKTEESTNCILVTERSQLVGMLTERDVVRLAISDVDLSQVTIAEVMSQAPATLTPETTLQAAIALSSQQQIDHFPIVDAAGNLVGLVTRNQLYQALEQQLQQELDQRQQVETALQQSESKFRHFTENSQNVMWIAQPTTLDNLYVSPSYERIWGRSRQSLLDRPDSWLDAIHPDDRDRVRIKLEQQRQGQSSNVEYRIVRPDGSVRWIWDWGFAIRNEAGQVYCYGGIAEDITERKCLEMERQQWLSQAETVRDQITTILESITDGFIAFDRDWHFTYVNAQGGRILQRDPDELVGKFVWSEFPDATDTAFYREYHRALSEQITVEFEEFYPPLDTWFAVHAYPSADGLVAYFQDITARKRVEEEIRTYAQQVEDLYNQAPCGYHSLDQNGVFVQINNTELAWLGYSRDEVIGRKKFSDLLTPESLRTFEANFPMFQQQGWVRDLEFQMLRKDGTILTVLVNGNAIRDEAGNYVMSRSTVYDISDRKQTEEALRESEERYRSLVTAMREGIVLQDRNGNILECNASAERILGLSRDQMMGRTSLDPRWHTIHEDGSPFLGDTHPAMITLRTGQPCSGVIMGVYKPDGGLTWISINSNPCCDRTRKPPMRRSLRLRILLSASKPRIFLEILLRAFLRSPELASLIP